MKALAEQINDLDGVEMYGRVVGVRGLMVEIAGPLMQDWRQLFTRPAPRFDPYSTPNPRLYFCSSSTPPGGGVHGMAGYHGAQSALKRAW